MRKADRVWSLSAASYRYGITEAAIRSKFGSNRRVFRLLLVSDGHLYTSEQQFAPLARYYSALRRHLGVVFYRIPLTVALEKQSSYFAKFDAVGLKLKFTTDTNSVDNILSNLSSKLDKKNTQTIYFDGDDDSNVQWLNVVRWCDLYVKKHALSGKDQYHKLYSGKSNLTDYVSKRFGLSFAENIIPSSGPLKLEDISKIYVGWNIALDDKIHDLFVKKTNDVELKDIDVVCRAFVPPETWIYNLRNEALNYINRMGARFRVLAPKNRVPQDEYYREMRRSRICVSPFGYGEICWRDFEAILCGCLLVKPDMGHVVAKPNVFKPGATYVSVKWDYSDLEETCQYYINNEDERLKIVLNAQCILKEALSEDWFVGEFSQLLERLRPVHAGGSPP
jgi:hypothetical protein